MKPNLLGRCPPTWHILIDLAAVSLSSSRKVMMPPTRHISSNGLVRPLPHVLISIYRKVKICLVCHGSNGLVTACAKVVTIFRTCSSIYRKVKICLVCRDRDGLAVAYFQQWPSCTPCRNANYPCRHVYF